STPCRPPGPDRPHVRDRSRSRPSRRSRLHLWLGWRTGICRLGEHLQKHALQNPTTGRRTSTFQLPVCLEEEAKDFPEVILRELAQERPHLEWRQAQQATDFRFRPSRTQAFLGFPYPSE